MMSKHQDLKALQKIWYEKLKSDGFEDIEDTDNVYKPLKAWHSFRFHRLGSLLKIETSEIYYEKAASLLHRFNFKNVTQRKIWELHSQGWSKRQIEKEIKDHKPSYKREWIAVIIKRISKEIV